MPMLTAAASAETNASTHTTEPLLVRACKHEMLSRPPVWLMRQAGRYMAEYQAIRSQVTFLELCKNRDLAVEVTMQPLRKFGMDAAILFSDILIPAEAMGLELDFLEKGPTFANPIRTLSDIERLSIPDPVADTGFVMNILSALRKELSSTPEIALIGFAGSPWTLATYMIEGGVSRNFTHIKTLCYDQPAALHSLLNKIAQTVILYLNAQIEAGAQVVQLFDTWGAILPVQQYQQFIQPYQKQVIAGVKAAHPDTPVILYVNNAPHLLPYSAETGADVISVDPLTSLTSAREQLGKQIVLQGNLDPNALFAKPETLTQLVQQMLLEGGNQNYIANLGHGILPQTPTENVQLFVDLVKQK